MTASLKEALATGHHADISARAGTVHEGVCVYVCAQSGRPAPSTLYVPTYLRQPRYVLTYLHQYKKATIAAVDMDVGNLKMV